MVLPFQIELGRIERVKAISLAGRPAGRLTGALTHHANGYTGPHTLTQGSGIFIRERKSNGDAIAQI